MDLIKGLCKEFCFYYKPSKEEGLACRGFAVAKGLTDIGKQIAFEKSDRRPGLLTGEKLREVLCPPCAFYDGDCDFILNEGDAQPCGGFIFLGLLIENGMINIDDIRNIE
jgi:hypothetical protein